MSVTAVTVAPVTTSVSRRMWSWPIIPAPMTPTRTVMVNSSKGGQEKRVRSSASRVSRVRPLVSGTYSFTKVRDSTPATTNRKKV